MKGREGRGWRTGGEGREGRGGEGMEGPPIGESVSASVSGNIRFITTTSRWG